MILVGDYIPKKKRVRFDFPADGLILANLEGPLVGDAVLTPIPKAGPNLCISSLGTDCRNFVFCLANNHMMDYGEMGLALTRQRLSELGVKNFGAGDNMEEARRPIIVEENGKKIGIVGCCERQFGCATDCRAGCAEKGRWVFGVVKELKTKCDFVIVSCHAGFEHCPLPSPRIRDYYRELIDAGADVVHGHHAHIPQGWEEYHNGVIFYGLGNFVVDPSDWSGKNHLSSVVVHLDFSQGKVAWKTAVAAVSESEHDICVRAADGAVLKYMEQYLSYWNDILAGDSRTYHAHWQAVCVRLYEALYGMLLKTPKYAETGKLSVRHRVRCVMDGLQLLCAALKGSKGATSRQIRDGFAIFNLFQCESHRDVISTALGVLNGSDCDLRSGREDEALKRFDVK